MTHAGQVLGAKGKKKRRKGCARHVIGVRSPVMERGRVNVPMHFDAHGSTAKTTTTDASLCGIVKVTRPACWRYLFLDEIHRLMRVT